MKIESVILWASLDPRKDFILVVKFTAHKHEM